MTVELKELRWFIETVRCGSFRRAAETLHIRQSTLSRRMADMECRLGVSLLERSSSGTRPTVIGREFHDTARHIVEEAEAAICRIKSSNGSHGMRLCLGVHTALSAGNMRATLVEYHRGFPSVELRIEDGSRHHLLSDLSANAIDVVIIINPRDTWK
ncbi:MAG: LysR family transcriptional regulator [Telmatospirillum sp.]|nr:LysR family transcriptional regulator [Telmatospirillum sp.]